MNALEPELGPPGGGPRRLLLRLAERAAAAAASYHRATLIGAHNLPAGPALLVGNHGMYGYETPVFFYLLLRATGRYPIGLAEKGFFRVPLVRDVLPVLGGVRGTRENALRALAGGNLVVCYPGGAREVFKRSVHRYALRWEKSFGFLRVAAAAGVPIVPFAGFGVDDCFSLEPPSPVHVRLADDEKYHVPLRFPVPVPAQLRFAIGQPLDPPDPDASPRELERHRDRIAHGVRRLLLRACHG